ncbi:tetratricopeptide repeat protein [Bernardetia sp. Wsw4-3y2]|uniref:tetratricopeptide repeat-containing sensor histidine kinase n=1 Tax=Bernardetia sp. Wsw4-3y2 TaxID=3127471 RepID=UPI0030CD9717
MLLTLFLVNTFCFAQKNEQNIQKRIDSLKHILPTQTDTAKAHTLYNLAYAYRYSEPQKAKKYVKEAILEATPKQSYILAPSLNLLGMFLKHEGDYQEALHVFLLALPLQKETDNKVSLASLNNDIGLLYKNTGNFERALPYYKDALKICEEIKMHKGSGMILNNIGVVHQELEEYEEAKPYYFAALEKGKIIQDSSVFATAFGNLGEWHALRQNYDSSLYYSKMTLEIDEKQKNKGGIVLSSLNIGGVYMEKKEFKKAKPYLETALEIAFEINAKPLISNTYNSLANYYEKQSQFEEAYQYRTKRQNLQDSILNESNQKEIARLREKYETEKKEQEIITLNQENQIKSLELSQAKNRERIQIGSFIFILILSTVGIISNQKRNQYKQKIQLAEKDNFYFAALVEAQEQERKRIAADLHDGLGQLLAVARMQVSSLEPLIELGTNEEERQEDKETFEKSVQTLDLACKEIRNVSHQMMPYALIEQGLVSAIKDLIQNINEVENNKMKISFSTNLINQESLQERLNSSLEVSIFRIVQEVIGNSLKHAEANQFEITLNQKIEDANPEILLLLKDNGKGFETTQITESKGLGWKNIHSRVAMAKGKIDILSKNGMTIHITFPYK